MEPSRVILAAIIVAFSLVACVKTEQQYTIAERTDVRCEEDTDCKTPPEYLVRSNCPYQSLCVEHRCTIVCPQIAQAP
jgi:hypothetical protein